MIDRLRNLRTLILHIALSPAGRALFISLSLWLLSFFSCRQLFWREPHSAFFQSEHIYDLKYSAYRQSQAEAYIESTQSINRTAKISANLEICAAFVTVKREHKQYIDEAVGSLLEGLTAEERETIWLYVLFAHTEPALHPSWQGWLNGIADEAGSYEVDNETLSYLQNLENQRDWREKGVFDFVYALDKCYNTGAPYIALFEDDIILADGWLAKTRRALNQVVVKSESGMGPWLYLRLFYSETYLQWEDSDFWYHHIGLTMALGSLVGFTLLFIIRSQSSRARRHLDNWTIGVLCFITIPAFIVLVFMVGKHALLMWNGIFELNEDGCCSQALVYPRHEIPGLVAYLRKERTGAGDIMIEDYANINKLERLALKPQVVQHVGLESSRGHEMVNTQSVWAFSFELYDPARLKKEHDLLTSK